MNHAGAIASNAGDDFHLIWAGKKIIEMLKPDSKLGAVVVEGPAWEDSITIEDQTQLYSIDMTEYFGGKNFNSAKKIVFSQLKYSAYLPDKEWNLSRLSSSSDARKTNSVIRRMADTYQAFAEKYTNVSGKIVLKLVSNQKLSDDLKECIYECRNILDKRAYKQTTALMNKLKNRHKSTIDTIYRTSKLSSRLFIPFIQALDFEDCGTGARHIHEIEIMQQMGIWGFNNTKSSYNNLIMAIRKCMLPEGKDTLIDRNWVKSILEIDERSIFPAPIMIEPANRNYIIKDGEEDTVKCLLESRKQWACLYGIAGVGKTTFIRNMEKYLPEDSAVVLYDCYGGGTFLQPNIPRHRKEIAIRQICNMMALECKTELLLGTPHEDYLWWDALKERLVQASLFVQEKNPEAIVAVILDAIDNSIFAATKMKQECFLKELLKLDLPQNVRIIATARTERIRFLPEIGKADTFEIPQFTKGNSSVYLRYMFPKVTDKICEEFHKLTNGNPRLQNYILSTTKSLNNILDNLRPNGKNLEAVFDSFIEAVNKQYTDIYDIGLLFFVISSLIPPIPIDIICSICNISAEMLSSICVECHHGFYVKNGELSFKDEDFEGYLRTKYGSNIKFIKKIANYLFESRNSNAYCARYVHLFLDEADQFERLIHISLNEEIDGATVGVAQSNKIMLERICTALTRPEMKHENNRIIACKLLYKKVDFCAGNDTLSKLLYEAPEEISLFCDEISIHTVISSASNSFASLGRKALLSVDLSNSKEETADFINIFLQKLNVYYKDDNNRGTMDRPQKEDIVRIAEAIFKSGSIDEAYKLLTGWVPKKAAIPFVSMFFKKMLAYGKEKDIRFLLRRSWSLSNLLTIICAYITEGKALPDYIIEKIDRGFDKMGVIPLERFSFKDVIQYFEYKIVIEKENSKVCKWLEKIKRKPVISSEIFYYDDRNGELNNCFRYYALKSFCQKSDIRIEDFFIDKNKKLNSNQYDKNDTLQKYQFLYEFFLFKLKVCEYSTDELETKIGSLYQKLDMFKISKSMNIDNQYVYEKAGILLLEGICWINNISEEKRNGWVIKIFNIGSWRREFYLKAIEMFSSYMKTFNECVFLLNEIDKMLSDYPENAEGMINIYLICTKFASKIDISIGKKFFEKAVACTREADTYSYHKIELFHSIVSNCGNEYKQSDEVTSYKLAGIIENYLRRMGDTKNFPYENAIAACTSLGVRGIWNTICRMDDRNDYDWIAIEDTLPIVLCTLLNGKKIDIWQTTALSVILLPEREPDYFRLMEKELEVLGESKLNVKRKILKMIIDDILYNVPMSDKRRCLDYLMWYFDKYPTDPELDIQEIKKMNKFLQKIKLEQYADRVKYGSLLSENDREEDLKNLLKLINDDNCVLELEKILDQIASGSGKYSICQLDCIADFVEEKAYIIDINSWRQNESIKHKYFLKFAYQFINYNWDDSPYEQFNRIFKCSSDEKFQFMEDFLNGNQLYNADEYVQALKLMVKSLDLKESSELLEWCIEIEWGKCCISYSGSAPEFLNLVLAETEKEDIEYYIAMFLWRMFGHPDKKNRFRAQHALWRYTEFKSETILTYLFELYRGENYSKLYLDRDNYFFYESAQISFLEASLYLADRSPHILKEHYRFYEDIAAKEAVQHALKRHLAIKVCQKIRLIYEIAEKVSLNDCENYLFIYGKTSRYKRVCDRKIKLHFRFDTMDTLRYWYDNVARLFGCTQNEVAELCDFYIMEEFHINETMAVEWQKKFYRQQNYGRASNGHGTIPSYETLRKYAEWHSMFYAADYLRCKKAVVIDEDKSYSTWLDLFVPGMEDVWGYEMRSYPPLMEILWKPGLLSDLKGKEGYTIPENFVAEFMETSDDILLSFECNNMENRRNTGILVTSVIVKCDDLDKFILELKKDSYAINDYFYREDEEWENSQHFFVYPTCSDLDSFSEKSSDMKDPLSKGHLELQNCNRCLSWDTFYDIKKPVLKELRPRVNIIDKFSFRKWCEPETDSGYDKTGTNGYLVSVDRKYLLSALQQNSWTLVCKVEVELEDEYSSYKSKQDRLKKEALWIMKKDGSTDVIPLLSEFV